MLLCPGISSKVFSLVFLLAALDLLGATVQEDFQLDPVQRGSFSQVTAGTESSFTHDSGRNGLVARLDVDSSEASYVSLPFETLTLQKFLSFSVGFRVESFDASVPPTAFIGLVTSQHVENFGDGLTLTLSASKGILAVNASVDDSGLKWEGAEVTIQPRTDYVAYVRFDPGSRELVLDIFTGQRFEQHAGQSRVTVPIDASVSVDRIGIQNGGAKQADSQQGSMDLFITHLATPGRAPVSVSVTGGNVTEGTGGSTQAQARLRLSLPSDKTVEVTVETVAESAEAGGDFQALERKVTFAPGELSKTVEIPIVTDRLAETNEVFRVVLKNPINATLAQPEASMTILDDDIPRLSARPMTAGEGGTLRFPVNLSNPSTRVVEVNCALISQSAQAGVDFVGANSVLRFAPESVEAVLEIRILPDQLAEGNEEFLVRFSSAVGASLATVDVPVTILDDDPSPSISIGNALVVERNSGSQQVGFAVSLSGPSSRQISARYATRNGSATAGSDYVAVTGSVIFEPGETAKAVSVPVTGDILAEPDETFEVTLSQPVNAVLGNARGIGTISDDDRVPGLRVEDASGTDGAAGTSSPLVFNVRLSAVATQPVTFRYATFPITASAGVDYVAAGGTVTMQPGETNAAIEIQLIGDRLDEPNETFSLTLSEIQNAVLNRGEAVGTILNDDGLVLRVGEAGVTEGDGSDVQAVFSISLEGSATTPVTVTFATLNQTALAGLDFTPTNGLLRFQPGQTLLTVSVPVKPDRLDEPEEYFDLVLGNPVGATLGTSSARGVIIDNDPPFLTVGPVTVTEGSGVATNAIFSVVLSSATFEEVQVGYVVEERTASAGRDFVASTGTLVFPVGTSVVDLSVPVLGDLVDEPDETFVVRLVNPVNATLLVPQAIGTIRDDDQPPTIVVGDVEILECTGGTGSAVVSVELSSPSEQTVSVTVSTADGSARSGQDYTAINQRVQFAPGTTVQQVTIPVNCDSFDEPSEFFLVFLGGPSNGFVGGGGVGGRVTIADDDPPQFLITGPVVREGNSGITKAVFQLRLTSALSEPAFLDFATVPMTGTAGEDFSTVSGTLRFEPGETNKTVEVPVIGDTLPEVHESFKLVLSSPVGARLGETEAIATVLDDDAPAIIPEDLTVFENSSATFPALVPVRLSRPSPLPVTVRYATRGSSAVAGEDFRTGGGTLTFSPGETVGFVEVQIVNSPQQEGIEVFVLEFSDPVQGVLDRVEARVTIVDDDGLPTLAVDAVTFIEGDAGPQASVFSVRLVPPSSKVVTVNYSTINGTATAGEDFTARSGTLRFNPGETLQTIPITVIGDRIFEPNESFTLLLGEPVNASLAATQARAEIINDDPEPRISVDDSEVLEGANGESSILTFNVRLSTASATPVRVSFSTSGRSATPDLDFESAGGTLVIPAGSTSQGVQVRIKGDNLTEPDEALALRLANAEGGLLERSDATGIIRNDDGVEILVSDAEVREPDSGVAALAFKITLARPTLQNVSLRFQTANGSAVAGLDFESTSGSLTFPPGLVSQEVLVPVTGDLVDEPDETLRLLLSDPVNGALQRTEARGTILDNDPPAISIGDTRVFASQVGSVEAEFLVTLSSASAEIVEVKFATVNGSATGGTDFDESSGTLVIPAGQTRGRIPILVKGNSLDERNEAFFVRLSNPRNATLADSEGIGTILSEVRANIPPAVSINEPAGGSEFRPGASIRVAANASDPDGLVAQVEFFDGTRFIGSSTNAPFVIQWTGATEGLHTLTARAVDDQGANATSAPVSITVAAARTRPVLSRIPNQTMLEDSVSALIPFTVSDRETPAGGLRLLVHSSNPRILPENRIALLGTGSERTLQLTPSRDEFGELVLTLTVIDADGMEDSILVPVAVLPVNDQPLVALPEIIEMAEDDPPRTVQLTGIAFGPGNERQSISIRAGLSSQNLLKNPLIAYQSPGDAGTLQLELFPDASGEATLILTVQDDGGTANGGVDTTTRRVTVKVAPRNDPPLISKIPDLSQPSNLPIQPLPFSLFDLETTPENLVVTARSSNPLVLSDDKLTIAGVGTNRTLLVAPQSGRPGTSKVVLTVTDAGGLSASSEFNLNLLAVNQPPSVSILEPSDGASFPAGSNLEIRAVAADVDGQVRRVEFFAGANRIGESTSNPFGVIWRNPPAGIHSLTARAFDDGGLSGVSAAVNVAIVAPQGTPPSILSHPESRRVLVGTTVLLEVSASGSIPLSYQWRFNNANIPGANEPVLKLVNVQRSQSGSYSVLVSNPFGSVSSSSAQLKVGRLGEELWSYPTKGSVRSSPALAADGSVYVGSDDGRVYGLTGLGEFKWSFETGGPVYSSPVVDSAGRIFFGSFDGKLYALSSEGRMLWSYQTGGEIYSSPAVGVDGTVYVGSYDTMLHAVNPDGTKAWTFATGNVISGSPALGFDGTIYIGSQDQKLYAIGRDGVLKWEFQAQGEIITTPAIDSSGNLYVGSLDRRLYALKPDGKVLWQYVADNSIRSSAALGPDGSVYFGTDDGKVYALSAQGRRKWVYNARIIVLSSPAVGADGTIYIGSFDTQLHAIGPNGAPLWVFAASGAQEISSSPVLDEEGVVYLGSLNGKVYAILGSTPPADSDWPMFLKNSGHLARGSRSTVDVIPPRLTMPRISNDGLFVLEWSSEPGRDYGVEFSSEPGASAWTELTSVRAAGTSTTHAIRVTQDRPAVYYRIKVR